MKLLVDVIISKQKKVLCFLWPAQVGADMRESKIWAQETMEDTRLRPSMKASSKGNVEFL